MVFVQILQQGDILYICSKSLKMANTITCTAIMCPKGNISILMAVLDCMYPGIKELVNMVTALFIML